MVRRGDRNGVDILIFKHLADIRVALGARVVLEALGDDLGVDVAEGDDADPFNLLEVFDVIQTAAAEADDGDAEVAIGARGLGIGLGAESGHGGSQGRVLDERTTIELGHRLDWG